MKFARRPLFLAALLAAGALHAQSADLQPRWIVGKRYTQLMTMQQETKITVGPQTMDQNVTSTTETTIAVQPHEAPGKKRLLVRYEYMTMGMDMAGQKMSFDSRSKDPAADPMGLSKALGSFTGKEMRLVVDEQGKITEFENLEELLKPAVESNPVAGQMLKGVLNKETIAQGFEQAAFKALPGKPIKPGDTWPYAVNMAIPQMGTFSIKGTYTFKGLADKDGAQCAEVTEEGQLTLDLAPATSGTGGQTQLQQLGMKIEGGAVKGTTWFDTTLGTVREAQFTQDMTMRMNNPTNPQESMEIPMKQTINIKLTGVADAK